MHWRKRDGWVTPPELRQWRENLHGTPQSKKEKKVSVKGRKRNKKIAYSGYSMRERYVVNEQFLNSAVG